MDNNHDYMEPEPGTVDWHVPLNQNFEQLDVDVEIRDTEANLSDHLPKQGAKFFAVDTENVFLADGTDWHPVDSEGRNPRFRSVNGDQFVSKHPGGTLSERLKSALDSLDGGQGTVYVTPRSDGEPWQWGDPLTLDPLAYNGIEIIVGHSVEIEYGGDGTMLTFDSNGVHQGDTNQIRLVGGRWVATDDAEGWLRLKDIILGQFSPQQVDFSASSNDDCFGVSVENHDLYSEANRIEGDYSCPVGIQYVPASETGGSGTDSFHDNVIDQAHINASNVGVHLAGIFQYCDLRKVALFGTERGTDLMVLDAPRMDGTVMTATKWESPPNPGGVTGIVTGPAYDGWYGPTIVGGWMGWGVSTDHRNDGAKNPTVVQLWTYGGAMRVRSIDSGEELTLGSGGDLTAEGTITAGGPIRHEPLDTSTVSSPKRGMTCYHDGSGSLSEGPVYYDGESWKPLGR
jgi:hypothetical protein